MVLGIVLKVVLMVGFRVVIVMVLGVMGLWLFCLGFILTIGFFKGWFLGLLGHVNVV